MNSSQKGKAFERWDRDGVAQHRNTMHEIAMQKQLSMYQREEKLLEKELREISKVKETLLQIRAPLRRKVQAAAVEDNSVESTGVERNLRKVSAPSTKSSVAWPSVQQSCTNKLDSDGTNVPTSSMRTSFQTKQNGSTSSTNSRQRNISVLELPKRQPNIPPGISGEKGFSQGKISAPAFYAGKRPVSEDSDKSGFLPIIKTPEPPLECSPSVKRKTPLLDRPLSASKDTEVDYNARSPSKLSPIAPSRADTTISRARSVPCDLPSHPITPRGRRAHSEADEVATLTMEETLRIKGKFRQIGHSVIATALLKGLKQKGQLSSEAIHNMHKPISLGEGNVTNNEENKGGDESTSESKGYDEDAKASTQGQRRQTFRNIARKTINVNRMLSVRNNARRRSQSDPSLIENSMAKAVTNSKEKRDTSAQSKDFGSKGATIAGQQRRSSITEIQRDNTIRKESESENTSQTQQMSVKQSAGVDPFRPLMNPRTAHARRKKNTFTGEFIFQSPSGDIESQQTQLDEQTTGNKSVRFASDAGT
ncbi:uncharacterized protein LOC110047519 [Orbicella faveolata]|uniref:uncharacterized protein LOC110047519 n=1 Tax=Orbicella faveolata TaxID=48498 RepID=UPI0009E4F3BD|nr:uncharacterized protein LOC110047519 [Orbicella faveolata]